MKNNASYNRFIVLLLVLLTVLNNVVISQGTDSRRRPGKASKLCMTLNINPSQTSINSKSVVGASTLVSKKGSAINVILDADYYFSPAAGISVGIGYNSFASTLSLDTWSGKFQTTDIESESYEMRITGKTIVEDQKISFVSIPICITLRFPADGKIGFNLKAGIGLNIPMAKKYEGTGTFTYDGYYAAYPILIQNLAVYGFPSDLKTSSSGTLLIKSFNPSIIASGSAFYALNETIQIVLGVCFNKSMSNISSYKPDANFRITSKASEMNSFMGGSSDAGVQALGLSLGIRYNLK